MKHRGSWTYSIYSMLSNAKIFEQSWKRLVYTQRMWHQSEREKKNMSNISSTNEIEIESMSRKMIAPMWKCSNWDLMTGKIQRGYAGVGKNL